MPKNTVNFKYIDQLISASSSVGANYIEANESLSKKDFVHRIKICRKEAKESEYWLELLKLEEQELGRIGNLINESIKLRKIFGAILQKSK